MIREDTHVAGGRRQVDLHDVCGGKDRLVGERVGVADSSAEVVKRTHLVREDERKFYFVAYFGIPATAQGQRSWGTSSNGGDETECRHRWAAGRVRWVAGRLTKAANPVLAAKRTSETAIGNQDPGSLHRGMLIDIDN